MLARLAFFLLLIVPPMALAADARPSAGKIAVVRQPAKAVATAPAPAPTLPPVAAAPASPRASDCRMDCAQTHYACAAGNQPGDCSGQWSQCVAACSSPNLASASSTAP